MDERGVTGRPTCPACGSGDVSVFFEARGVPTLVNFLHATREGAVECPRGDIVLALCGRCELMSNVAFDPSKLVYGESYENPLHHSALFRTYAAQLAEELVARFDLRGKTLVEIGCGDGSFLRLLCEGGRNRGVGFDPSFAGSRATDPLGIEIVQDCYSEKYSHVQADFIYSRHTLEHVKNPADLLESLRRSIGDRVDTPVFFEVPNGSYTLRNCFVWDIIYEHTSYFTARSLSNVLENSGFRVARVYEAFSGQYVCAEAFAAEKPPLDSSAARQLEEPGQRQRPRGPEPGDEIDRFVSRYREYLQRWERCLKELRAAGKRVAVWGAGSKGVTFLNTFDVRGVVEQVVDINPRKHGMFVAGTGQLIVAPEELTEQGPDTVLVVNPVYRAEVEESLGKMGLVPEVITL